MIPLGNITKKNNLSYHSHADDTPLYISISSSDLTPGSILLNSTDDINC